MGRTLICNGNSSYPNMIHLSWSWDCPVIATLEFSNKIRYTYLKILSRIPESASNRLASTSLERSPKIEPLRRRSNTSATSLWRQDRSWKRKGMIHNPYAKEPTIDACTYFSGSSSKCAASTHLKLTFSKCPLSSWFFSINDCTKSVARTCLATLAKAAVKRLKENGM